MQKTRGEMLNKGGNLCYTVRESPEPCKDGGARTCLLAGRFVRQRIDRANARDRGKPKVLRGGMAQRKAMQRRWSTKRLLAGSYVTYVKEAEEEF